MVDTKRPSYPKRITPTGIAVWPKLDKPDTKFKAEGRYSVKLKLPDSEADQIIALIDGVTQEAFDAAFAEHGAKKDKKGKPIEIEKAEASYALEFDDQKEPTGFKVITFGMNAQYKDKKTGAVKHIKPIVVDAKGNACSGMMWGGSRVKVAYQLIPYYNPAEAKAGCSIRLAGVQVIELVKGGADELGFKEEEGYVAEDEALSTAVAEGSPKDDPAAAQGNF